LKSGGKYNEKNTLLYSNTDLKIKPNSKIFVIGSCFSRMIEEELEKHNFNLPVKKLIVPKSEWPLTNGGLLNKFNLFTANQSIEWAANCYDHPEKFKEFTNPYMLKYNDDYVSDVDLHFASPVSQHRFWQRREQIKDISLNLFSSDIVLITMGQTEVWRWVERNLYLPILAINPVFKAMWDDIVFEQSSLENNLNALNNIIKIIRERNPNVKFLLSISPASTHRYYDPDRTIQESYWYSKYTLKEVVNKTLELNDDCYYWNTFECLTVTDNKFDPEDPRRISKEVICKMVNNLLKNNQSI
jgi:hypothetical protein